VRKLCAKTQNGCDYFNPSSFSRACMCIYSNFSFFIFLLTVRVLLSFVNTLMLSFEGREEGGLPSVSIVTPCHNGLPYLSDYFSSILSQDYTGPIEVSMFDDASTVFHPIPPLAHSFYGASFDGNMNIL
jgi:cellulose synthase/poly-beta-1,6-N-acetylglucosamine synthase-like glycosyltransferase